MSDEISERLAAVEEALLLFAVLITDATGDATDEEKAGAVLRLVEVLKEIHQRRHV